MIDRFIKGSIFGLIAISIAVVIGMMGELIFLALAGDAEAQGYTLIFLVLFGGPFLFGIGFALLGD